MRIRMLNHLDRILRASRTDRQASRFLVLTDDGPSRRIEHAAKEARLIAQDPSFETCRLCPHYALPVGRVCGFLVRRTDAETAKRVRLVSKCEAMKAASRREIFWSNFYGQAQGNDRGFRVVSSAVWLRRGRGRLLFFRFRLQEVDHVTHLESRNHTSRRHPRHHTRGRPSHRGSTAIECESTGGSPTSAGRAGLEARRERQGGLCRKSCREMGGFSTAKWQME